MGGYLLDDGRKLTLDEFLVYQEERIERLEAEREAFKERLTSEAAIRDADLAGWNASRDLPIPDEGSTEPITKAVVEAAIKAAEEQV